MLSRSFVALGLALVVVGASVTAPIPSPTGLRYKFKEGEKLHYDLVRKMTMNMSVGGNEITMKMNQNIDTVWHVLKVDRSGTARMTQTITRIRFEMDMQDMKIEYDSKTGKMPEGPIGEAIAPLFKAMVNEPFKLNMDPQGNLKDIEIPESLKKAAKDLPAGAAGGLGEMFTEEGFKNLMNQASLVLPREGVMKGKTWKQVNTTKMPSGKSTVTVNYTYDGPITRAGKTLEAISLKPSTKIELDECAQLKIKVGKEEASGKAYFDKASGRLVEVLNKTKMNLDIEVGCMSTTQTIEQSMSVKLREKK